MPLKLIKICIYVFFDYTKAFDNVRHVEITKMFEEKDLSTGNKQQLKSWKWIKLFPKAQKRCKTGLCPLSRSVLIVQWKIHKRHVEYIQGILISGYNVNNICYADGTVLQAKDEEPMQSMLSIVVEESEKKGLSLNDLKLKQCLFSEEH